MFLSSTSPELPSVERESIMLRSSPMQLYAGRGALFIFWANDMTLCPSLLSTGIKCTEFVRAVVVAASMPRITTARGFWPEAFGQSY